MNLDYCPRKPPIYQIPCPCRDCTYTPDEDSLCDREGTMMPKSQLKYTCRDNRTDVLDDRSVYKPNFRVGVARLPVALVSALARDVDCPLHSQPICFQSFQRKQSILPQPHHDPVYSWHRSLPSRDSAQQTRPPRQYNSASPLCI